MAPTQPTKPAADSRGLCGQTLAVKNPRGQIPLRSKPLWPRSEVFGQNLLRSKAAVKASAGLPAEMGEPGPARAGPGTCWDCNGSNLPASAPQPVALAARQRGCISAARHPSKSEAPNSSRSIGQLASGPAGRPAGRPASSAFRSLLTGWRRRLPGTDCVAGELQCQCARACTCCGAGRRLAWGQQALGQGERQLGPDQRRVGFLGLSSGHAGGMEHGARRGSTCCAGCCARRGSTCCAGAAAIMPA
jgi:hypothetical protein